MNKCMLCNSKNIQLYIQVKKWRINQCLACGVLSTWLGTKSNGLIINKDIYNDNYISNYKSRESVLSKRFLVQLHRIEEYIRGGSLLDIGCSTGMFFKVISNHSKYRWRLTGIEINKKLASEAKKSISDVKIDIGALPDVPYRSNVFDCVTCFDVLEHLMNLNSSIMNIKRILKPGGILLIQAPNYKSLMAYITSINWDWWSPPDHTLHFSVNFITNYLEQRGFEVIKTLTYEDPIDYWKNVKGSLGTSYLKKFLIYLLAPILLFAERIGWRLGFGGLMVVVAKKNAL